MTNFDFLLSTPAFKFVADMAVAVASERIYAIGPATCNMND